MQYIRYTYYSMIDTLYQADIFVRIFCQEYSGAYFLLGDFGRSGGQDGPGPGFGKCPLAVFPSDVCHVRSKLMTDDTIALIKHIGLVAGVVHICESFDTTPYIYMMSALKRENTR